MGVRSAARLFAVIAALALVAAACGDDEETGSSTTETTVADLGLVKDGTLTACSDTPYEPFEFEGDDGEQTGYDIDLMRAIAELNDLELEVKDVPFDGILGLLAAGECDVITSAVSIKPERAEQVDFSDPYFDSGQSILVRAAEGQKFKTLDDLAGETIGVQSGTTGETYANENKPSGATIRSYEDADGLFLALESGDIAAILQDYPVNAFRSTKDDKFVVTQRFETDEQYGFAVEKGNTALLDVINDGLTELRDTGEFDRIFQQYFGDAG